MLWKTPKFFGVNEQVTDLVYSGKSLKEPGTTEK